MDTKNKIEMPDAYITRPVFNASISLLGKGWYNQTISMTIDVTKHDLENIESFDRESVQDWIDSHSGDFQSITDFCFYLGEEIMPWANEDNEATFNDCMYGGEDE